MKALTLHHNSYAKINWFLNVFPIEEDAEFHSLETVMQRIALADSITLSPRDDTEITFTVSRGNCNCTPENNIILKAVHAFRTATGITQGFDITLEKHIPVGAGLGGGSSNAATTLLMLNELCDLSLSQGELHHCATQLGADVPFFLSTSCALCKGRGDNCTPVAPHRYSIVLWKPQQSLSTKDIYAHFDTQKRPQKSATSFCSVYACANIIERPELIWNNLAIAACEMLPRLNEICTQAENAGAVKAWVSGSGPTVVALCTDDTHALTVKKQIRSAFALPDDFLLTSYTIT